MSFKLSIWHKLLLLVLIPLVFEITFVSLLAGLLQFAQQESDRYEQSKEVMSLFNKTEGRVMHAISKIVVAGTTDPHRFDGLDESIEDVRRTNAMVQKTASLRPELIDVVTPTSEVMDAAIALAKRCRKNFLDGQPPLIQLMAMRKAAVPLMLDFETCSRNLLDAERRMKSTAPHELEQLRNLVLTLLVLGTIFSIVISVGAAWIFVNDILKRLRVIEENARFLAIRQPLQDAPMGDDELADLDGALKRAEKVLDDTRRKEVAILDVATDVICSLDKRLRVTDAGAASLQSWGYDPDEVRGRVILSLQTKDGEALFRSYLEQAVRSKEPVEFESIFICKNGTHKDFLWKVTWSDLNQSYYCVAHDVSARRAADRMKQRFIAIVSHDLRTPLSSISATLSVLLATAQSVPEGAHKILQKAEDSLERLMDLIRDLLDLEKLEAGKVVLDFGAVSVLDVCNAACDSVEYLGKSLNVKLARPSKDAAVTGDERRLVRVLINLISNAIKFSPRGSTVTISVDDLGAMTEIGIRDEGPGIPLADQEKIFEKFQQSKTAQTTSVKGTGLGLAISKLIVEGHSGEIGVQSEPGKGSRFYVRIPNFDMGDSDE